MFHKNLAYRSFNIDLNITPFTLLKAQYAENTTRNMPGEDGYSLIRQLRSREPEDGGNIPAIALTAMARPEDSERALSSGFQLHIAKPVDIDDLSRAVRRFVERRVDLPADAISNA